MEDDDDLPPEMLERMIAILDKWDRELDVFFRFPDWFPEPIKITYRILLSNLLNHFRDRWPEEFDPRLLRSWIDHAMEYYADPTDQNAANFDKEKYPTDFGPLELPLIFELARCEYGAGLPPAEGLKFLVDKKAAHGLNFSLGGANKRGKEFEPKASIRLICEKIKSVEFKDLIEALNDADFCADCFESTSSPIGIRIEGVDDFSEKVTYTLRGASPNDFKTVSFGRLRNILSEIKKI